MNKIAKQLANRGYQLDTRLLSRLESRRKELQSETETLQNKSNVNAKAVGLAKSKGEPTTDLLEEVAGLKKQCEACENQLKDILAELSAIYLTIPNLPHASVPIGQNESQNKTLRHWGKVPHFDFAVKDHVALGEANG